MLNWTWGLTAKHTPGVGELRRAASKLLEGVLTDKYWSNAQSSGGFLARRDYYGGVTLMFVVEEYGQEAVDDMPF